MYTLRVARSFVAQHYLTVPNCGPENEWHSHHFKMELLLEGKTLNENGYLVDIVEVENILDSLVDRYRDATLNDLPEFEEINPSVEHFSRIICSTVDDQLSAEHVHSLTARIWEDDQAWASYSTK